jgi:hypothetical protein
MLTPHWKCTIARSRLSSSSGTGTMPVRESNSELTLQQADALLIATYLRYTPALAKYQKLCVKLKCHCQHTLLDADFCSAECSGKRRSCPGGRRKDRREGGLGTQGRELID